MNTPTPHAESATKVICEESPGLDFVISQAINAVINSAMPDLPPLLWLVDHPTHYSIDIALGAIPETEEALEAWAAALRLAEVEPHAVGTRRFEGSIRLGRYNEQHHVHLWCVVDQDAYDARKLPRP